MTKRMAEESSLNRKKKKLQTQNIRKKTISKNMGKYNRLSFFWVPSVMFDDGSKIL